MRVSFLKSVSILVLVLTILWIFNMPTLASEGIQYYFGLKGPYHYLEGDFDGKDTGYLIVEENGNSYRFDYLLFELVDNYGAGVTFGGYNDFAAGEISYSQSKHKLAMGGVELEDMDEAVLDMLNFDFKFFQPNSAARKARLYGQVGLVVSALSINDSVEFEGEYDDAFYTGYGYNLGFGLMINIGKRLVLDGSVIYQRIVYDEIKTFGLREDVPEDLTLATRTYNLGIKYCF